MIFIFCLFFFHAEAYSQDWLEKIIPLQTTVEEVEKLITLIPERKGNGKTNAANRRNRC